MRRIHVLFAVASILAAPAARAAPDAQVAVAEDPAEVLLQQGSALLAARDLAAACERLEASDRLRPSIQALDLLAECHEQQGRIATAYREYLLVEARARAAGDKRAGFARAKVAALDARVPRVRVVLRGPAAEREATCNGQPIEGFDGGAVTLRLDPGRVELVGRVPAMRAVRRVLDLTEGMTSDVDLTPTERIVPDAPMPPVRRTGIIVTSLGVGLIGGGLALGGAAISRNNASKQAGNCTPDDRCTPEGGRLRDQARAFAIPSTVLTLSGVAATVAGITVIVATKDLTPRIAAAPLLGPGLAGASVAGSF